MAGLRLGGLAKHGSSRQPADLHGNRNGEIRNMSDDDKVRPFPAAVPAAPRASAPLPPGKLEMVITYLEMLQAPSPRAAAWRAEPIAIIRARRPTVSFYRYLYATVGRAWMWYERCALDDAALAAIVQHPLVEVYVLYLDGVPAGYVELDRRQGDDIELAYFGLMPEFIGRGLGRYLLDWAVGRAFEYAPDRLWVHTCNHDHPGALAGYQRAGFQVFRQERTIIDDPRH
jgi:ribosomal protein S18 acetylase RimI-like enzyme